ncbi:MAG: FAD-dependent oxidoreductase [Acidimicrobiales bacterium]
MAADQYDLVIVGSGPAGTAAAAFAVGLELRVAVVERDRVGGRARWSGSVPSKALVDSARVAHTIATAGRSGVHVEASRVDLPTVWRHVREVQATADEAGSLLEGADLVHGHATLTGPNEVTVSAGDDERILQARFVLLCTGSRPVVPDLPGIGDVGVDTDETVFEWEQPPSSAIVLGGGPMGVELAQSFQRLGIATALVEHGGTLLPRSEPSLVGRLTAVLVDEGVDVITGADVTAVRAVPDGVELQVHTVARGGSTERTIAAAALVACTDRRPDVDRLGLDALGLLVGPRGIVVDERGRTTFRTVYAVGDVTDVECSTHEAEHAAVRAVRDMFFPGRVVGTDVVPSCTFSDPELAQVGLTAAEAEARHDDVDVWRIDLDPGAIVVVTAKEKIVGGHVLAPGAGELIHELALAVRHKLELADLAQLVHVRPTVATSLGRLAAESSSERAQRYRWLVRRR